MLGANIGGKDRGADNPPAQVASGKEVVGGGVLSTAHHPPGHTEENAEVNRDHHPVDPGDTRLRDDAEQQCGQASHLCVLPKECRAFVISVEPGTKGLGPKGPSYSASLHILYVGA